MSDARESFPTITLQPVGRCIYCRSTENLEDEHIVPYALDGHILLPKASCRNCSKITSYIEGYCARKIFFAHRVVRNMQTRRARGRPSHLPITLIFNDGRREERLIPAERHPGMYAMIAYQPPGMLVGRPRSAPFGDVTYILSGQDVDRIKFNEYVTSQGATSASLHWHFDAIIFARMLAKIAHAAAVPVLGLNGFAPFLPSLILKKTTLMPYYVGTNKPEAPSTQHGHRIGIRRMRFQGRQLALADIQLFAQHTTPEYCVVVGELPPNFEPPPEAPRNLGVV